MMPLMTYVKFETCAQPGWHPDAPDARPAPTAPLTTLDLPPGITADESTWPPADTELGRELRAFAPIVRALEAAVEAQAQRAAAGAAPDRTVVYLTLALPWLEGDDRELPSARALLEPRPIPVKIVHGLEAAPLAALFEADFRVGEYPELFLRFSVAVARLVGAERDRTPGTGPTSHYATLDLEVRQQYATVLALARSHFHASEEGPAPPRDPDLVEKYRAFLAANENGGAHPMSPNESAASADTEALACPAPDARVGDTEDSSAVAVPTVNGSNTTAGSTVQTVPEFETLPVGAVHLDPERERRVDLQHVDALAESIRMIGLTHPILVTAEHQLIAGAHRLLAHRRLGERFILARILDVTGQKQRLAEIDENLVRRQLPVLELAMLTMERKELYEALHPEAKQHHRGGHAKAAKVHEAAASAESALAESFASDMSAKTGMAKRSVQELAQIATISAPAQVIISGTPLASQKTDLIKLARLPEDQQEAVAIAVTTGTAASIAEAVAAVRTQTTTPAPYAVTQAPVIKRQRALVEKLQKDLQATAKEWEANDAFGMQEEIEFNQRLARALAGALDPTAPDSAVPAALVIRGAETTVGQKAGKKGGKPKNAVSEMCDALRIRTEAVMTEVLDAHMDTLLEDIDEGYIFAHSVRGEVRGSIHGLGQESAVAVACDVRKLLSRRIRVAAKSSPAKTVGAGARRNRRLLREACELLGVDPPRRGQAVDEKIVKTRFRTTAKSCHPDTAHCDAQRNVLTQSFKECTDAYAYIRGYNADLECAAEPAEPEPARPEGERA